MDSKPSDERKSDRKDAQRVTVVEVTDPTAADESNRALSQDVVQLDAKRFSLRRVTVPLHRSLLIFHASSNRGRSSTTLSEEHAAFVVVGSQSKGSINGIDIRPDSLIAASPGTVAELVVEAGYESATLLISPSELRTQIYARWRGGEIQFPSGAEVWSADTTLTRQFFELGASIAETARLDPEVFDLHERTGEEAREALLDALLAVLATRAPRELKRKEKTKRTYSDIVGLCQEFALERISDRLYMSDLCEVAGVSERTLQYAFREVMQMSPLAYLRTLRLHRVRHELRNSKTPASTVTESALKWGFWHFGEFSRVYRECFGELPSQTLRDEPGE